MEHFAKMIYEQWCKENDERDLYFKKGTELNDKLHEILSINLINELYDIYVEGCIEIEQTAFIAGFAYACKCLSNGKIELGGGK